MQKFAMSLDALLNTYTKSALGTKKRMMSQARNLIGFVSIQSRF